MSAFLYEITAMCSKAKKNVYSSANKWGKITSGLCVRARACVCVCVCVGGGGGGGEGDNFWLVCACL